MKINRYKATCKVRTRKYTGSWIAILISIPETLEAL